MQKFKAGDKVRLTKEYLAAPYASKHLTGIYEISHIALNKSHGCVMALIIGEPHRSPRLMHEKWLELANK